MTETLPQIVAQNETIRTLISDAGVDFGSMSDAEMDEYMRKERAGEFEEVDNVVENDDGSQTWNNQKIGMGAYESLPIQVSKPMAAVLERLGSDEGLQDLIVDLVRDGDSYRMVAAMESGMMHLEDGSVVEL